MLAKKYKNHACIKYADEIKNICQPLNQIDITYFAHVYFDGHESIAGINNNPYFFEHYLNQRYFNADIHLAKSNNFDNYIVFDSIELAKESRKINEEAKAFGIQNLFTIIENDTQGKHYYHFANNSSRKAINQFYINNVNLLQQFIYHFKSCVNTSKHIASAYDVKFKIDTDIANFTVNNEHDLSGNLEKKISSQSHIKYIESFIIYNAINSTTIQLRKIIDKRFID